MPAAEPIPLPDVAIGHHPTHGVVASLPTQSAAAEWMLERLDFQRLPGNPKLFTLTDQHREAPERAAWATKLLTGAGYQVDTDMALSAGNTDRQHRVQARQAHAAPDVAKPQRAPAPGTGPDVAIAEHPSLGIVAAVNDDLPFNPGIFLETDGWRLHRDLDVYLPPAGTRAETLDAVARTTVGLQRGHFQVAMLPGLAEEVSARRTPAQQAFTTHKFRVNEAALKAPAPVSPPPAAVDPRIAFARAR
ncbi:hypothetical protein ACFRAR_12230 [Kitasatospora sp. NPDC056651]|uniref:hypothetical protein n=1 Tax=Kitasatospora sp. NPDC056651 TaxID=3345892 RepID=UPI00367CA1E3